MVRGQILSVSLRPHGRGHRALSLVVATTVFAMVVGPWVAALPASADPFTVLPPVSWSPAAFSPNGDGVEDSISSSYCLSANANETTIVQHKAGTQVRQLETGVSHPAGCSGAWTWDGKDGSNTLVLDGLYEVVVTGTDSSNNHSTATFEIAVDNAGVASVTQPANGATVSGSTPWTVAPAGGRTLTNAYGPDNVPGTAQGNGTYTGTYDTTQVVSTSQDLVWTAEYADVLGSQHSLALHRTVTVNNPETVIRLAAGPPGRSPRTWTPSRTPSTPATASRRLPT